MQHPTAPRSQPMTPIERLLMEKKTLAEQCSLREKQLSEDFEYIRNNASALFLSGLSELLFSSFSSPKKSDSQALVDNTPAVSGSLATSGLLGLAGKLTPIVWEMVKPALIKWGISKAKAFIIGLFAKNEGKKTTK